MKLFAGIHSCAWRLNSLTVTSLLAQHPGTVSLHAGGASRRTALTTGAMCSSQGAIPDGVGVGDL